MNNATLESRQPDGEERLRLKHLEEQALELFDGTQKLHELDNESRQLLAAAAAVPPGFVIPAGKKPLKFIRKWIAKQATREQFGDDFAAESTQDAERLTILLALHCGAFKPKDVLRLDLPPLKQREVLTLASLLNIASGLNKSASRSTNIEQVEISLHRLLLVVEGPQAVQDAIAAQRGAKLWEQIGYPKVAVLETSQIISEKSIYPAAVDRPGIDIDDTLAEAGRKVMRYQFAQMLKHEAGTRAGEDIEALHDMRVATRRLRAAFEVFDEAFDPKALKQLLKGLRATGRVLGEVRDMDVFMEKAQHYLDGLPEADRGGLAALLQDWHMHRDEARNQMLDYLDSEAFYRFKENFSKFVLTPGAGALPIAPDMITPYRVKELAPALIYDRMATVRAFEPIIAIARVEQLHALRIEFKKLRYTVEYFKDVLGAEAGTVIEMIKKLQDHLGDLNDAQIAAGLLQQYEDQKHSDKPHEEEPSFDLAIEAYRSFRLDEMAQLIETFPQVWDKFNQADFRKMLALAVSVL